MLDQPLKQQLTVLAKMTFIAMILFAIGKSLPDTNIGTTICQMGCVIFGCTFAVFLLRFTKSR